MFTSLYDGIKTIARVNEIITYLVYSTTIALIVVLYYYNCKYTYLTTYGFFWVVNHSVWFFYLIGIPSINSYYFQILCYYLVIRLEEVNELLVKLGSRISFKRNKWRSDASDVVFGEHNRICWTIAEFNRFWRKFLFSTLSSCVPLVVCLIYQIVFVRMNLFALIIWITILLNFFYVLYIVTSSAALISATVQKPYNTLNSINPFRLSAQRRLQLQPIVERISKCGVGFTYLNLFCIRRQNLFDVSLISLDSCSQRLKHFPLRWSLLSSDTSLFSADCLKRFQTNDIQLAFDISGQFLTTEDSNLLLENNLNSDFIGFMWRVFNFGQY